jgi:hypothetical protein
LPSITCSFTPLINAAGLRTQTCRCTCRSKKPRNPARCWLRLAATDFEEKKGRYAMQFLSTEEPHEQRNPSLTPDHLL